MKSFKDLLRIIYSTPEFKGQVLDTITGNPVEKAIIEVNWFGYGKKHEEKSVYKTVRTINDNEGRYIIPNEKEPFFFDRISAVKAIVIHPLYVETTESEYVLWEWDSKGNEKLVNGEMQNDGSVRYDFRILGLEEKYKDINSHNDFLVYLASQNKGTFDVYKYNGIEMNFENIFSKWEEIAIKCGATPGDIGIFRELQRLKKIYHKVMSK